MSKLIQTPIRKEYFETVGRYAHHAWDDTKVAEKLAEFKLKPPVEETCTRPVKAFSTEENAKSVEAAYIQKGYKTKVLPENGKFTLYVK